MANGFLFLKTRFKRSNNFELWNLSHNKRINIENFINKSINFNLDFEEFKYDSDLRFIQFLNEGKELLIEQFQNNCWRAIIFSLEKYSVRENLVLKKTDKIPQSDAERIFFYKNKIFFQFKDNAMKYYDLIQKKFFIRKFKYFDRIIFDKHFGIFHFINFKNEMITWQIDSVEEYLIKFDLDFLLDETTISSNFFICAGSYYGGLINVNLKTNKTQYICYNSDHPKNSLQLNNKIFILDQQNDLTIWDLNLNKILQQKNIKVKKDEGLLLKEIPCTLKSIQLEKINFTNNSIVQFNYNDEFKQTSTKILPSKEISQEFILEKENYSLIFNTSNQTISLENSRCHWTINSPELIGPYSDITVCERLYQDYAFITLGALYRINLGNGEILKLLEFRKHDNVTCMRGDKDLLFIGMEGFRIFIFDLYKMQLLHNISTGHESPHSFIFCSQRNYLFVASHYDSSISIFDVISGKEIHSWEAHNSSLAKLFYLPDQNALCSVCHNNTIKKWGFTNFELLDEYYALPAMPDKGYKKGWAHIDKQGNLHGSIHHKEYFAK